MLFLKNMRNFLKVAKKNQNIPVGKILCVL